jgi:serine protease AprX
MNMPIRTTLLLLLLGSTQIQAQNKQWLIFKDKGPETTEWQSHPERFLSQKAIDRRVKHGVGISAQDYPVSQSYLSQLAELGLKTEGHSKWLNAVSTHTDMSLAEIQAKCPAVVAMQPVGRLRSTFDRSQTHTAAPAPAPAPPGGTFDYGATLEQLEIINIPCLHSRGYTGSGVLIAQFDSGFLDVNTITAFDSLRNSGRLISYYDFVNHDTTVFDEDWHGLAVLSTFAGYLPGSYVGSAPHVNVALGRTETVASETHQEEDNWLMGAEWADSMGADIIQSSLGYYEFDNPADNYTYADMDGNTTIISKAADWAASRGILVCNSAGNEGASAWHYIIAPCDGDSVMCVGGVDNTLAISSFSSIGPSSDAQVKPDVVAVATNTSVVGWGGLVNNFNGTSFSSPQMAGFAACLIQAHPLRTNMEIIHAIQQSADRYLTPDSAFGYGLPDACKADSILTVLDSLMNNVRDIQAFGDAIKIFPNPSNGVMMVEVPSGKFQVERFRITNIEGKVLMEIPAKPGAKLQELDVHALPSGSYLLESHLRGNQVSARKFVRN